MTFWLLPRTLGRQRTGTGMLVGHGAHFYSFLFLLLSCSQSHPHQKSAPSRWNGVMLQPIKIIVRSSSLKEFSPKQLKGGVTWTSCVFLNEPVLTKPVCATVLASGQLGGFGGQWERQGGAELVSQRWIRVEEKKVTQWCRWDRCKKKNPNPTTF